MKNSNLKIFFFLFCTFLLVSCEKEEVVTIQKEKYPIHYRFVNTTNYELRYLNFKVKTFFPVEWKTNIKYQRFSNVKPHDTIIMTIDTTDRIGHLGYIGCQTQMEVNVYNDINSTLTYVSTWWTNLDTIKIKTDADVFFNWPNDTLNCQKIDSYTIPQGLIDYRKSKIAEYFTKNRD